MLTTSSSKTRADMHGFYSLLVSCPERRCLSSKIRLCPIYLLLPEEGEAPRCPVEPGLLTCPTTSSPAPCVLPTCALCCCVPQSLHSEKGDCQFLNCQALRSSDGEALGRDRSAGTPVHSSTLLHAGPPELGKAVAFISSAKAKRVRSKSRVSWDQPSGGGQILPSLPGSTC